MKNTFVKVLSFMMALTMIVGAFGAITVSAADCAHTNRTAITVVAPTCGTAGFTSYECDDCGEKFIGDIKNATGEHSWKDVPASEATCDDPAYGAHKECTVCEATDPADLDDVKLQDPLPHVWNIPYAQAATCTEDGFTSRKCAACDKVDDREPAAGLKASDENGWKVVSATDKATHKYVYTVVTEPAKCSSGYIKVTCSACDYTATIEQKVDHTWKDMKASDAKIKAGDTCDFEWKSGSYCVKCDTIKSDSVKNTANTHVLKEVPFATIDEANLTAEIQALGYNYNDKTSTEVATQCGTVRVFLAQCELCDVYAKSSVVLDEGKGHKWVKDGDAYYADGTPSHKEDKLQDYKCDNVLEDGTTKCPATKTEIDTEATACTYTKEGAKKVVAPTCDDNGYTEYKCDVCGVVTKGDITFKTGHNYGAPVYKSGTCDTADDKDASDNAIPANVIKYVQKCSNKDCDSEIPATTPEGKDKCNWDKVERKGTCMKEAYYEYECSVCKDTKKYDKTDVPTAGKDPTNHVAKWNATAGKAENVNTAIGTNGLLDDKIVEQTCTTSQVDRYMCQCGVAVDLTVGAAPAHDYGESYTDADGNVISVAVKPANCKEAGIKTAGEICKECGTINPDKKPEVAPIDPTAHKDAATATPIDSDVATCSAKGYTKKYYTCCAKVEVIETTTGKDADNHTTKGVSNIKEVAKVPATCLADGKAAHYKCSGCGKLFSDAAGTTATTEAALKLTNPGNDKKHDWNTTTVTTGDDKAKAETCTVDGTKEYYTCKATGCLAIKIKDSGAVVEGYAKDTTASDPINKRYPDLKIPAHGTAHMGWHEGVEATCTTDGYTIKGGYEAVYACSQCDKKTVGKTNHVGTTDTEYYNCTGFTTDGKPVGVVNCLEPTFTLKVCTKCNYTFFETYNAAKSAHTFTKYGDADGDKKGQDKPTAFGTATCTTAAQDTYECTVCDHSEKRAGAAALGHKIDVNGVKIAVDFGCTSEDHKTYKNFPCVNPGCGAKLGDEAKYEHDIIEVKKVEATCTTTGNEAFKYCVDCGIITDGVVKEIPANGHSDNDLISVENGVAKYSCDVCGEFWTKAVGATPVETLSANKVAAGEVVTLTYAISGKDAFNAKNVTIDYNATMLTFVGVEANADLAGLYAFASVNAGSIGVALVVENDAEGNAQNVETPVDGTTVLFTLTFVANKTASGSATIGTKAVEITPVGNLNGDAVVTAADAQAIFSKIGSNDVAADVNNDGIVNFADVAALATFAASNKTAKDYLVMVGEYAAIEAEVYALLDAGRLANHDTDNNVINVNDALELIADIETGLAGAYATLGNNVTAAAVVAYYNAK